VRTVAAVAAAVLTQDDCATYLATGPETLSVDDVAAELSAALGKAVRQVPAPVEATRAGLVARAFLLGRPSRYSDRLRLSPPARWPRLPTWSAGFAGRPPHSFASYAPELVRAA